VLDEDEFARTLIPELFKHNNYASFVRQLNMYGFHKKVGLSDNSMKASETKAKAPSEYFNKYFRRGRSELLWLIQKPKNPTAGPKRKREEDGKGDSDEERKYVQDTGGGGYVEELAVRGNNDMAMIPRSEYNSLRVEVRQLQEQQKLISNVLTQIKRQNEELYSRATSFQALHDRHENSINAILTFLATFYNRSLEGNANGMNLADMFPAARQQSHGNVVDVDEFPAADLSLNKSPQLQRPKRPLALLPAPTTADGRGTATSPTTNRPIPSPITRPGSRQQSVFKPSVPQNRQPATTNASQSRDASSTAPLKIESPPSQTSPGTEAIMSAIRNVNASANPTNQALQFDFSGALSNLQTQDGNVPLTPQERNDTISRLMSDASAAATSNALTNPNPAPDMLNQHQATQQQFQLLQNLSHQQSSRVQSLQERFQSLSPSGQIQGLDNGYFDGAEGLGDPGQLDLDLDDFVHQDQDFFPDSANGASNDPSGLPDFNFDTATPGDANGFTGTSADAFYFGVGGSVMGDENHLHVDGSGDVGSRVESVSSNATSPAVTVEEVEDEERARSPKKRKK
jgi:heat shock transcription factor